MLVANPITYDGRVLRHATTLVQAGHEVFVLGVLGPSDRDEPPPQLGFEVRRIDRRRRGVIPRLRWFGTALRQRAARGVVTKLPEQAFAPVPALGHILSSLSVATSAPELLFEALRLRPDVIHANDLNTLPAAAWAGRILSRPYIYDAHELYFDEHPDLDADERRIRVEVEQHHIRNAASVITVNDLIADELATRYAITRPVVLRNLPRHVDVKNPATRPLGQPDTLRLLYHGAHVGLDQHGVDDILRALARLKDKIDVTLLLRGGLRPSEKETLCQRLAELAITDRVKLLPPVPGAEALVHAAVSDDAELGLAVHPPLCGSYIYTTSSKLYEYQAAGLGVVASDVIGNRHTVAAGAGVFYPAGDDETLAAELLELAQDRKRLRAMQEAAYAYAQENLDWARESLRLLDIYKGLPRQAGAW